MNELLVAWHGIPDGDCLRHDGVEHISMLGRRLKQDLSGRIRILVSPALRAECSGWVLSAELFGRVSEVCGCEIAPCLDCCETTGFPKILELVRAYKEECDVLILMTHSEVIRLFPDYYRKHELGRESDVNIPVGASDAIKIDCKTGERQLYSPAREIWQM